MLLGFYYKWKYQTSVRVNPTKMWKRYNKLLKILPKKTFEVELLKHEFEYLTKTLIVNDRMEGS